MVDHSAEIEHLKSKEAIIQSKLNKLNGPTDSHLEGVAKSFHLGMVGGSGRNNHKLNQRRERSLDKTISNAVEATALYKELDQIQTKIKDLEAGGPEKRAQKRQEKAQLLSEWWKQLKAGDTFDMGDGDLKVQKKNAKSLVTAGGCTWKAIEIIGKDAAALL